MCFLRIMSIRNLFLQQYICIVVSIMVNIMVSIKRSFFFVHFKGRTLNTCSTLENVLKMKDDKTKEKYTINQYKNKSSTDTYQ